MSFLKELCALVTACGLPVETGVFSGEAPDEYLVITPLADTFEFYAHNCLKDEKHCGYLSLYAMRTYIKRKNAVVRALLGADFTITMRHYIGHEDDSGYHHYSVDVAKTTD